MIWINRRDGRRTGGCRTHILIILAACSLLVAACSSRPSTQSGYTGNGSTPVESTTSNPQDSGSTPNRTSGTSDSISPTKKPSGKPSSTSRQPTQPGATPLIVDDSPPTASSGKRPRWKAQSSIEIIRQVDLEVYKGRSLDSRPLEGITVVIDAGHGGKDAGTVWPTNSTKNQVLEKTINLQMAFKSRDNLEKLGATVILTRDKDDWPDLYKRIAIASRTAYDRFLVDAAEAGRSTARIDGYGDRLAEVIRINDHKKTGGMGMFSGIGVDVDQRHLMDIGRQYPDILFISLHVNAYAKSTKVRGAQVYYQTGDSTRKSEGESGDNASYHYYDDAGRKRLAETIKNKTHEKLPEMKFQGKGDVLTSDFAVLREQNLVSVMFEMGFISNDEDRAILVSENGQDKLAQAVAEAVYAYYCE